MRRKIASAATAALLAGGIAAPATANAADSSPFSTDWSAWLAPTPKPADEKPVPNKPGSPFDSPLSDWLQPAPGTKPVEAEKPAETTKPGVALPPTGNLGDWLAPGAKPTEPKPSEPETEKPSNPWLDPNSVPPTEDEIKPPSGDDLGGWLSPESGGQPQTPPAEDTKPEAGAPEVGEPEDSKPEAEAEAEDAEESDEAEAQEDGEASDEGEAPEDSTDKPEGADNESNTPVIAELAFAENSRGRTLSWKVEGCSVQNQKTVKVSLSRGGESFTVRGESRAESTNASTWPAGTYTVTAKCVSLDGKEVFGQVTKEIELKSSNMWVHYFGEPLYGLVPNPGERVTLTTHAPANGLPLKAGPYEPGETVVVSVLFDVAEPAKAHAEGTEMVRVNADANGHLTLNRWLPQAPAKATGFVIVARGEISKRETTYSGTLSDSPRSAFVITGVDGRRVMVGPSNMDPSASNFTSGALTAEVLGPDGKVIVTGEVMVDAHGKITGTVALPEGKLEDGRYTVRVLSPLGVRGYHAAYFTVKNGVLYPTWDIPADAEMPEQGQPGGSDASKDEPGQSEGDSGKAESDKGNADKPEMNEKPGGKEDAPSTAPEKKAEDGKVVAESAPSKSNPTKAAPTKTAESKKLVHAGAGVAGLGAIGAAATALGALLVGRRRREG